MLDYVNLVYPIARTKLSTLINISNNIPGPIRPISVMARLTDRTVQLFTTNESAKCPATI